MLVFAIVLSLLLQLCKSQCNNETSICFQYENLNKIKMGHYNSTKWYTTLEGAHHAIVTVADPEVSTVANYTEYYEETSLDNNITGKGEINITGLFLGYNSINLTIVDRKNTTLGTATLPTTTVLSYQKLNNIFTYILYVCVGVMYVNMGATLDIEVVKRIVKQPVGPAVGLFCQYILMPLFAFGLAKLFFSDDTFLQLGLFLNGASPGGGPSNMWTLLLGGSLDLSIMMTVTSTLFAFGTVPMWVLTLGPKIVEGSTFQIPYLNIVVIVLLLVFPCSFGIGLQFFFPKVAHFLARYVLKFVAVFNLVMIATFGVYVNRYIFALFTWKILGACILLPLLGYASGAIIAYLCKRTFKEIIAISIETGVQNANIAIVILKLTLEPPAGELTVVIPACNVIMTQLPLIIALGLKTAYGRFCGKVAEMEVSKDGQPAVNDNGNLNSSNYGTAGTLKLSDIGATQNGVTERVPGRKAGLDNPGARLRDDEY